MPKSLSSMLLLRVNGYIIHLEAISPARQRARLLPSPSPNSTWTHTAGTEPQRREYHNASCSPTLRESLVQYRSGWLGESAVYLSAWVRTSGLHTKRTATSDHDMANWVASAMNSLISWLEGQLISWVFIVFLFLVSFSFQFVFLFLYICCILLASILRKVAGFQISLNKNNSNTSLRASFARMSLKIVWVNSHSRRPQSSTWTFNQQNPFRQLSAIISWRAMLP